MGSLGKNMLDDKRICKPWSIASGLWKNPLSADTTSFVTVWDVPNGSYVQWPVFNLADSYYEGTMVIEEMNGTVISTQPFSGKGTPYDFRWENTGTGREVRCRISGKFGGVSTYSGGYASGYSPTYMMNNLVRIEQFGSTEWADSTWGFRYCSKLNYVSFQNSDFSNMVDSNGFVVMFTSCDSLLTVDFTGLKIPSIATKFYPFNGESHVLSNITSLDFSPIQNFYNVELIPGLFKYLDDLTSVSMAGLGVNGLVGLSTQITNNATSFTNAMYGQLIEEWWDFLQGPYVTFKSATLDFGTLKYPASVSSKYDDLETAGWTLLDGGME